MNKNIINEEMVRNFNLLSQTLEKIDRYEKRIKDLRDKLVSLDTEHKRWQEEKTKILYSLESSFIALDASRDRTTSSMPFFTPQPETKNEIMLNNLLTHMFTEPTAPPPVREAPRIPTTQQSYARSPTSGLSIRKRN